MRQAHQMVSWKVNTRLEKTEQKTLPATLPCGLWSVENSLSFPGKLLPHSSTKPKACEMYHDLFSWHSCKRTVEWLLVKQSSPCTPFVHLLFHWWNFITISSSPLLRYLKQKLPMVCDWNQLIVMKVQPYLFYCKALWAACAVVQLSSWLLESQKTLNDVFLQNPGNVFCYTIAHNLSPGSEEFTTLWAVRGS